MNKSVEEYYCTLNNLLTEMAEDEKLNLEKAGKMIADSIAQGGTVHFAGNGHSHMMAEEANYRAGGFVIANAILEPSLMLHEKVTKGSQLENLSGYAKIILDHAKIKPGDVIVITSNSGANIVVVEMAIEAKERGLKVIAMTSLSYSKSISAKPQVGKKLYEIADIVIDNHGIPGDAAIEIDGLLPKVGPTSTIIGASIINSIVIEAAEELVKQGITPPIIMSLSYPGAKDWNERLFKDWGSRIPYA